MKKLVSKIMSPSIYHLFFPIEDLNRVDSLVKEDDVALDFPDDLVSEIQLN